MYGNEAPATRKTVADILEIKQRGEKVVMLTAYDYPSARLAEEAGVDMILVGDSLGMVVLGYESTLPVTLDDMLHHTKPVVRGSQRAMVVTDLPFMTYQTSVEDAMRNAGRLIQEGGSQAVKLEGGVHMAETVRRITQIGIPVVGHIGLTPQAINQLSGYKVQGRTPEAAERLIDDAIALQQAGAFAIVLETIPAPLAGLISNRLRIPTIGIGAGAGCDGQVQVWHDLLSYSTTFMPRHMPRHVKQYAQVGDTMRAAIEQYAAEVRAGAFPTQKESFQMPKAALEELTRARS
ncbi:MAG TPA: 3-methyl-2-oxobutanoate hydroxymethyltransferase [Dehalococcoidia bacterium]|jgi:3-methyl-2-oxobutanoate hydroxymethyltransferase|nr:3-methyl-2-oxobutanoate hydroxymethyltransferase [Dehalococcoidia bacterium]